MIANQPVTAAAGDDGIATCTTDSHVVTVAEIDSVGGGIGGINCSKGCQRTEADSAVVTERQIVIGFSGRPCGHDYGVTAATSDDDISTAPGADGVIRFGATGIGADIVECGRIEIAVVLEIEATKVADHQIITEIARAVDVGGNSIGTTAAE